MKTKIINAEVITLDKNNTILKNAEVHIDGEHISYAGTDAPDFSTDRTIDAKGRAIMPGFVNTHTHLPMNLFRSYADDMELMEWLETKIWPAENRMDEQAVRYGTLTALAEMAAAGITAFSDAYYLYDWSHPALLQSGMRALISRSVVDTVPEEGEKKFAEMLKQFASLKTGRIDVGFAAHAVYTASESMLKRIAEAAKEHGAKVQIHVSETKTEINGCTEKYGKTPVRLLRDCGIFDSPVIAAHCVWVTDTDIDILKEYNVAVSHCPSSNLKLASGISPISKMKKRGVNITLGTDSASSNNALSVWREMTFCSMLQKGLELDPKAIPAEEAMRIATQAGDKALGINAGSIEKGKLADIIMIDTSDIRYFPKCGNTQANIVYSGSDADVCMTMVGGDIIYENGEVKFCDIEECKAKINEFIETLQ